MGQGPGEGQKLALPGGEGGTPLGNRLFIALGQPFNKVGGIHILCRGFDFFGRDFVIVKPDIAFHRPLKDEYILLHLADGTAQLLFA